MKLCRVTCPAKDLYTAKVAIEAGANAVYLGGKTLVLDFLQLIWKMKI